MASDTASFALALIDQVTAPGRKIEQQLKAINREFKKTGELMKLGEKTGLGNFDAAKMLLGAKASKSFGSALDNLNSKVFSFAKYAGVALAAAGIAVGTFVVQGVVHMGMFADASRRAFGFLTGSASEGNQAFNESVKLSKQLGTNVEETTGQIQKMLALQFKLSEAETFVKLTADLRAVGASADAVGRVLLDITHIKATGFVSGREMRSLANAGVSVQLINEEIGKALHMDPTKVHEAITKKKVTADIALPAIQRAIMRKTHEHEAGEAGTSFAQNTLTGLVGQLQNAPSQFFLKVAAAADKSIQALKPLVRTVMDAIEHMNVGTAATFVSHILDMVQALVPLALEFGAGFGEGMKSINAVLGTASIGKDSLKTAHDLGVAIAEAFAKALELIGKLFKFVEWLNENRWVAKLIAGLWVALNIVRMIAAVWSAGALVGGAGKAAVGIGARALAGAGLRGAATAATGGYSVAAGAGLEGLGVAGGAAAGAEGGMIAGIMTTVRTALAGVGTAITTWAAGFGVTITGALVGAFLFALAGIALAITSWKYREEGAKFLTGLIPSDDQAEHRGITADDLSAQNAQPTDALKGLQAGAGKAPQQNQVTVANLNVNVDGEGKDAAALGKDISEQAGQQIEQHWQGLALESGG